MLDGCTPWPKEFADRYRAEGYWEDITLGQMLERSIARAPGKVAIVHRDGRISYGELGERISQLAVRFLEHGLEPRERAVMQLTNSLDFVLTFFARL